MEVKKVFINRDIDIKRKEFFECSFLPNIFERYPAIDGWTFTNGELDHFTRPIWNEDKRQTLIDMGDLHEESKLTPIEWSCSQSHIEVWKAFLRSNKDLLWCSEDDIEPIGYLKHNLLEDVFIMPDNCDILYLFSPKHKGHRIFLYKDSTVKFCRSHMSYIMTRKGAEQAIKAMRPIVFMSDTQVFMRIGKSIKQQFIKGAVKNLPVLEQVNMCGMFNPIVQHNKFAIRTTFTKNGRKDYIAKSYRI